MTILRLPCHKKRVHSSILLLELVPLQGAACYQEGKHTFPLQRPRGALRNAEKAH